MTDSTAVTDAQPTLRTERLVLRPFRATDRDRVVQLCDNPRMAETLLQLPSPYELDDFDGWFASHEAGRREGTAFAYAVCERAGSDPENGDGSGDLVGCVGLLPVPQHAHAEIGFWFGESYWGRGYATEAVHAVMKFGFLTLGLHRIHAGHFVGNDASRRVQEKLGMREEGLRRGLYRKGGRFIDSWMLAILEDEFEPDYQRLRRSWIAGEV